MSILLNFKNLFKNYFNNLNISIKTSTGTYLNKKVHTNFYLKFSNINIHLALFYERGDFFWIGGDENENLNEFNNKWFGDKNRGINLLVN